MGLVQLVSGHILVVDDEQDARAVMAATLQQDGYTVATAADARGALSEIARHDFDVIISDIVMPEMTGIELLDQLRESSPDSEAIIVTAFPSYDHAVRSLRAGAFDFIEKPAQLDTLLDVTARALGRRRQRQASKLVSASQAIFDCQDPQQLPELIVNVAMTVMEADDVTLMLLGSDDRLHVAYSHGLSNELQDELSLSIGERIAGRVAERRVAEILNGPVDFERRTDERQVRSSIVYPLVSGEQLLGVLNINRVEAPRQFRQWDLERASVLASQVVLALANAGLVRELISRERLASIGQLSSTIMHEVNNPLTYVSLNVGFIEDLITKLTSSRNLDRPLRELLDDKKLADLTKATADAQVGVRRINEIVADMRTLARTETSPKKVDLNDVVRSALRFAQIESRYKAELDIELGTKPLVQASPGALAQVVTNLLVNAALAYDDDYTPKISVRTSQRNDLVILEIADEGRGIEAHHLPRIWEPFFTTRPNRGGTGLGLWISREIVAKHEGRIKVESEPRRGTTVFVELPAYFKS